MQARFLVIEDNVLQHPILGMTPMSPTPELEGTCSPRTRILVVEDDALQQSILKAALEADGYQVETASDGLDAVWKIREGRFDLALIDYRLPEIDGLATARLIGDLMGEVGRPRLVALTATPECVIGRELLAGQAFDGIVAKSVDLPALLATVGRFLRSAPGSAARHAANLELLLGEWSEYDTVPHRPEPQQGSSPQARILVVEDDELQCSVLRFALAAHGYDVETASDGLSAVRKLRRGGYDLALIDYELPEIDGLAMARLIRDLLSEAARPRLVAHTAAPDRLKGRGRMSRCAFDDVVDKSTGLPTLLATIDHHLRCGPGSTMRDAVRYAASYS